MTTLFDEPLLSSASMEMKYNVFRSIDEPIEKLSVKDICRKADISRDTFYRYFTSKYDIIVWHGMLVQSLYLNHVGRTITWEVGFLHDLRLLQEEVGVYSVALKDISGKRDEFIEMEIYRRNVMIKTIKDYHGREVDEGMMFCIENYAHCETRAVTKWLAGGCKPGYETFCRYMLDLIPQRLYEAIQLRPTPASSGRRRSGQAGESATS